MEAGNLTGHDGVYLDTHVVVWLYASGGESLSDVARERIEAAGRLLVSPMVRLELAYLYELERITESAAVILDYLEQPLGLEVCDRPFDEVATAAARLTWTRDPFDRLITAQAAVGGNLLLTKDAHIREHYARALW